MVDRKVVPFDEFYYQLKLMYLFLLHVVCIKLHSLDVLRFFFTSSNILQGLYHSLPYKSIRIFDFL
jgi:hypothetical protein